MPGTISQHTSYHYQHIASGSTSYYNNIDLPSPPFVEYIHLSDDDEREVKKDLKSPVIIWWTGFTGERGRIKRCGNVKCFFTVDRKYKDHPGTKVNDFFFLWLPDSVKVVFFLNRSTTYFYIFGGQLSFFNKGFVKCKAVM